MFDPTLWGLFSGSFLASTLLPGGSEALLLLLISQNTHDPILLWSIATAGNALGGMSSWLLGWLIKRQLTHRPFDHAKHQHALLKIEQYGSPTLLLSWLPIVGDPLCLAAGWIGIRPLPALIFITIGKGLRYAALLLFI
jgi:membrane protein YqaA with SNARE-associated domain